MHINIAQGSTASVLVRQKDRALGSLLITAIWSKCLVAVHRNYPSSVKHGTNVIEMGKGEKQKGNICCPPPFLYEQSKSAFQLSVSKKFGQIFVFTVATNICIKDYVILPQLKSTINIDK